MTLALLPIAAAAVALATAPALAKSKKHHTRHLPAPYAQPYAYDYGAAPAYRHGAAPGWTSRVVSDPSFGNRAGINYARGTGRCVADLGYGRYEYCGW